MAGNGPCPGQMGGSPAEPGVQLRGVEGKHRQHLVPEGHAALHLFKRRLEGAKRPGHAKGQPERGTRHKNTSFGFDRAGMPIK